VQLGSRELLLAVCEAVQRSSPVASYTKPVAGSTPGYASEVPPGCIHVEFYTKTQLKRFLKLNVSAASRAVCSSPMANCMGSINSSSHFRYHGHFTRLIKRIHIFVFLMTEILVAVTILVLHE
jgi:hypothetical protein